MNLEHRNNIIIMANKVIIAINLIVSIVIAIVIFFQTL